MSFSTQFSSIKQTTKNGSLFFFSSNEEKIDEVTSLLPKAIKEEHGVYVGTSGMQNFDVVSYINENNKGTEQVLDKIMIIDISRSNQTFYKFIEENIHSWNSAEKANTAIMKHIKDNTNNYCRVPHGHPFEQMLRSTWNDLNTDYKQRINSGKSWLSTDSRFNSIKNIFKNKNFVHLAVDLSDQSKIKQIKEKLGTDKIALIYVSNVRDFLDNPMDIVSTIDTLTDKKRVPVIEAEGKKPVEQKLKYSDELVTKKNQTCACVAAAVAVVAVGLFITYFV